MSWYWDAAASAERDRSLRAAPEVLLFDGPPLVVWEERVQNGWALFVSRVPGHLASVHCRDRIAVESVLSEVDKLYDEHARRVSHSLSKFRLLPGKMGGFSCGIASSGAS